MADNVELLNRGIELAPATILTVGGYDHIDKGNKVSLFTPPAMAAMAVSTLGSLVTLLEENIDDVDLTAIFIHVKSESEVEVISRKQDIYGVRRRFISAEPVDTDVFMFGQFIGQEQFNIGLRSKFVQDGNLQALLAITGNLSAQNEAKQEDDGVTQRVTVKRGIAMLGETTPPSRVTLAPFRTFPEVTQPASEFVFRIKCHEQAGNQLALFEADGGAWKIRAMATVREYLQNALRGISDPLAAIPVIS